MLLTQEEIELEDLVLQPSTKQKAIRDLLLRKGVWINGTRRYHLEAMTENHIINCINKIKAGDLDEALACLSVFEAELTKRHKSQEFIREYDINEGASDNVHSERVPKTKEPLKWT